MPQNDELIRENAILRRELKKAIELIEDNKDHITALQKIHQEHIIKNELTFKKSSQIEALNQKMKMIESYLEEKEEQLSKYKTKYFKYKKLSQLLSDEFKKIRPLIKMDSSFLKNKNNEENNIREKFSKQRALEIENTIINNKPENEKINERNLLFDVLKNNENEKINFIKNNNKTFEILNDEQKENNNCICICKNHSKSIKNEKEETSKVEKSQKINFIDKNDEIRHEDVLNKNKLLQHTKLDNIAKNQSFSKSCSKIKKLDLMIFSFNNKFFETIQKINSKIQTLIEKNRKTFEILKEKNTLSKNSFKNQIISNFDNNIAQNSSPTKIETLKIENDQNLFQPITNKINIFEQNQQIIDLSEQIIIKDRLIDNLQAINKQLSKYISDESFENTNIKTEINPSSFSPSKKQLQPTKMLKIDNNYTFKQNSNNEQFKKNPSIPEKAKFQSIRSVFYKDPFKRGTICVEDENENTTEIEEILINHDNQLHARELLSFVSEKQQKRSSFMSLQKDFLSIFEKCSKEVKNLSNQNSEIPINFNKNDWKDKNIHVFHDLWLKIDELFIFAENNHNNIQKIISKDNNYVDFLNDLLDLITEKTAEIEHEEETIKKSDFTRNSFNSQRASFRRNSINIVPFENNEEKMDVIMSKIRAGFTSQQIMMTQMQILKIRINELQTKNEALESKTDNNNKRESLFSRVSAEKVERPILINDPINNGTFNNKKSFSRNIFHQNCLFFKRTNSDINNLKTNNIQKKTFYNKTEKKSTIDNKFIQFNKKCLNKIENSIQKMNQVYEKCLFILQISQNLIKTSKKEEKGENDKNYQEIIDQLQKSIFDLKNQLIISEEKNSLLEENISKLKTERNNLQMIFDDKMQNHQSKLIESKEKIASLNQEISVLRMDMKKGDLKSQLSDKFIENQNLKNYILSLEEKVSNLSTDNETISHNFKIMKEETVRLITHRDAFEKEFKIKEDQLKEKLEKVMLETQPYQEIADLLANYLKIDMKNTSSGRVTEQIKRLIDSEEFMIEIKSLFKNKLDINLERESIKSKIKEIALEWHYSKIARQLNESRGSLIV